MSNYVLIYYGEPKFGSPEEGAKYMAKWRPGPSALAMPWSILRFL
jgi:uncharacterized protein (DUF169 family)